MQVSHPSPNLPTHTKNQRSISKEELQKQILYLCMDYRKSPEKIAKKLPNLVERFQQTVSFHTLLDIIFKKGDDSLITTFLMAMQIAYPEFTLSPFDQIRYKIVEDKNHELNNKGLFKLLQEHNLFEDDEKLDVCFDLAFRLNHPYIYRVADTPIPTSDYSLNFLWINLNPQDRTKKIAQNIFGEGLNKYENAECLLNSRSIESLDSETIEKIQKTFTFRLIQWAEIHPGAEINLWYDSALVTQEAWKNTSKMMKEISKSKNVNIKLRDIRLIPYVKKNSDIINALHPGVPVYYRVDLMKAYITHYFCGSHEESKKYCVVTDIDVEPMDEKQLFDQRTRDFLTSNGYVFNRFGFDNLENNFFIFNKEHEKAKANHFWEIIYASWELIKKYRKYSLNTLHADDYPIQSQKIYNYYFHFTTRAKEPLFPKPRKVVKCPESQFGPHFRFTDKSHQTEICRFVGESDIPYGKNGRYYNPQNEEIQIKELIDWKAEPLTIKE